MARLSGPVIYEISLLEIARLTIHTNEVAQSAAPLGNGSCKGGLNRLCQQSIPCQTDAMCCHLGVNARPEKTFRGINISHSDHYVARQQHLFYGGMAVSGLSI